MRAEQGFAVGRSAEFDDRLQAHKKRREPSFWLGWNVIWPTVL